MRFGFYNVRLGLFSFFALAFMGQAGAITVGDVEFRADFYERNLQSDSLKGRGNAWLKHGTRELWADEIEVDLTAKRAVANGNVHLKDGKIDVWCRHASQSMSSDEALLEEAVLISGSMVLSGAIVRRLDATRYEIDDGSYSHCNVTQARNPENLGCMDWRLQGSHFSIEVEKYAHVRDAVVLIRDLPIFYAPYFIAPVKTKRQSGLLFPQVVYSQNLGTGVHLPYFWAISDWHDATITPSYFGLTGFQLGLQYRYSYSSAKHGEINTFLLQRRFSQDRTKQLPDDPTKPRALGFIGEYAIDARNYFGLGGRAHSRQVLRLVSDPYYVVDHAGDFQKGADQASLRSLFSVSWPGDSTLLTGKVQHNQSLIISDDSGVDRGAVTELPTLAFAKTNTRFGGNLFSYEADAQFSNYYRPQGSFDSVSLTLNKADPVHTDPDPNYHDGNYIRTGRRLQLEPRLIMNLPLPSGMQFQPLIKAGTLLYHFDLPSSSTAHREYLSLELPASLYFSKRFSWGDGLLKDFSHVFQPRVVYAKSLYQSGSPSHPFFYDDKTRGLSNPRFDFIDQVVPFEYFRFELINRLRRKVEGGTERFFLLQFSEQYNLITSDIDTRFLRKQGPIEVLSEFGLGRFSAQLQANYQLETVKRGNEDIRENDLSASLEYRAPAGDLFRISNRIRINRDDVLTEKTAMLGFYKTLPIFFDVEGAMEYSYKRGELLGTYLSLIFGSKPVSCWNLTFTLGQNDLKQKYVRFLFRLDFADGGGVR